MLTLRNRKISNKQINFTPTEVRRKKKLSPKLTDENNKLEWK